MKIDKSDSGCQLTSSLARVFAFNSKDLTVTILEMKKSFQDSTVNFSTKLSTKFEQLFKLVLEFQSNCTSLQFSSLQVSKPCDKVKCQNSGKGKNIYYSNKCKCECTEGFVGDQCKISQDDWNNAQVG